MTSEFIVAFKLALPDFGRAINICSDRAQNYFFRGNCQSKLGNYELVCFGYKNLFTSSHFKHQTVGAERF